MNDYADRLLYVAARMKAYAARRVGNNADAIYFGAAAKDRFAISSVQDTAQWERLRAMCDGCANEQDWESVAVLVARDYGRVSAV